MPQRTSDAIPAHDADADAEGGRLPAKDWVDAVESIEAEAEQGRLPCKTRAAIGSVEAEESVEAEAEQGRLPCKT